MTYQRFFQFDSKGAGSIALPALSVVALKTLNVWDFATERVSCKERLSSMSNGGGFANEKQKGCRGKRLAQGFDYGMTAILDGDHSLLS